MSRTRTVVCTALAAAATAATAVALPALADKPGERDTTRTSSGTATRDCADGDTVFLTGPQTLWPPNHKMVAQEAVAQGGEESTTLMLTPTVTDAVGGDGGEQHDPDVSSDLAGTGTTEARVPFEVRAERSGRGTGRTYVFHWTATFDDKTCSSTDEGQAPFEIYVPHDQGKGQAKGRV